MGCFFTSTRSKVKDLPKPIILEISENRLDNYAYGTTVKIKADIDCDGCEDMVRKSFKRMEEGVENFKVDRKKSEVEVVGKVDPKKVLTQVQKTRKRAAFCPKPKDDPKKAPPMVSAGPAGLAIQVETMTNLFSDENPNACSIM
ncbi:hypothetical protein OROGR_023677 [Orobanche gracilis]